MDRERIIDRIRKLMRLSQSANPHEAALAAQRVQQMLSEHNLTMESVGGAAEEQVAQCVSSRTRQRLEGWAFVLAQGVSGAFDCSYYHDGDRGRTVFIGVGADPEVCGWMYGYLYSTLLRLASAHMRGPARRLRSSTSKREARASFLFGAVDIIRYRLARQKQDTPITPGALVPMKERLIAAAMPADLKVRDINRSHIREQDRLAGMLSADRIPLSMPLAGEACRSIA